MDTQIEKLIGVKITIALLLFTGFTIGLFTSLFIVNKMSASPSRSSVYEIPMADRREPWRVMTYRNKVYVLIEAPSIPEEVTRKEGPTK